MMPELRIHAQRRESSRATMKNNRNTTFVLVMALCNQPEACASDLDNDQSRYFAKVINIYM